MTCIKNELFLCLKLFSEHLYNLISIDSNEEDDGGDEYSDLDADDEQQWNDTLESAIQKLKKNSVRIIDHSAGKSQSNLSSSLPDLNKKDSKPGNNLSEQSVCVNNAVDSNEKA